MSGQPRAAVDVSHHELAAERDATAALKDERRRTDAAFEQCELLASEILRERRRHAHELAAVSHQLELTRATVRNMERSWFWRARRFWVHLRAAFVDRPRT